MTNIQFYNTGKTLDEALRYTCRLIQKVNAQQLPMLVQVPDEATGTQLDDLLWAFQDTAFVPHTIDLADHQPVNISWRDEPGEHRGVLINLGTQIPSWHGRFMRVLEIIYDQPDVIESKRDNYRFYKERGYPLRYFDLAKQDLANPT